MYLSVHASGQVHLWQGEEGIELLLRSMVVYGSNWMHAVQLRFLATDDAFTPEVEATSSPVLCGQ